MENSPKRPHVSIGNWIGTFFLMMIPLANIVLMFVWAFGSRVNRSKKNFFRAILIMELACIVTIVVILLTGGTFISAALSGTDWSALLPW